MAVSMNVAHTCRALRPVNIKKIKSIVFELEIKSTKERYN